MSSRPTTRQGAPLLPRPTCPNQPTVTGTSPRPVTRRQTCPGARSMLPITQMAPLPGQSGNHSSRTRNPSRLHPHGLQPGQPSDIDHRPPRGHDDNVYTPSGSGVPAGLLYCSIDPANFARWMSAHPTSVYPYSCPSTPPTIPPTGTTTGYTTKIYDVTGDVLSRRILTATPRPTSTVQPPTLACRL